MDDKYGNLLKSTLDAENYAKLMHLENPKLHRAVAEAIELCRPDSVFVCSDSQEDISHIRSLAVENKEEKKLNIEGHTIHFDSYYDQGRDKGNTRYLLPPDMDLGASLNTIDKIEGLAEIRSFLKGSMAGRIMIVRFFCLGPVKSDFSISGIQLTDSAYVAHSEDLLYRAGYEQFARLGASPDFFRVLHSSGRIENGVSADYDKRRVYIDVEDDLVYSVNTQYAGNTVGFKKLCLRLAIRKADREGWLAEHMFVMGVHGPDKRITYFTGAYPSACGKTSTAMIPGETVIGDDLAYLRVNGDQVHAVNVESGIFGIIRDVNAEDDPLIWKVLTNPGEVIFSNVLDAQGTPYWLGDGRTFPEEGVNHSGPWFPGKIDDNGEEIPIAHPNSRYTFRIKDLDNRDERADDPEGVPVGGIIYGARDSDTSVPVKESFDWTHGVITMGAALESETTAATLGKVGVRTFQPMSNMDFVSLPLGKYINNHLDFVKGLRRMPRIFASNYFLKGADGNYLTSMKAKYVWVKWMELRVHDDVAAVKIPVGNIPTYENLKRLFKEILGKNYTREEYEETFTLRVPENLAKLGRIEHIYREQVIGTPQVLFEVLKAQRERIEAARDAHGEYVSPFVFAG